MRTTALVGHMQPLEGVAIGRVSDVLSYLRTLPPPAYVLSQAEELHSVCIALSAAQDQASQLRSKNQLIELILTGASARQPTLMGIAPSSPEFSPLAMLSLHRQIFETTNDPPRPGPVEQVFTVAPMETVEVRLEEVRRKTFEEAKESSSTASDEVSTERSSSQEFTDRFLDRVDKNTTSTVTANASATFGIVTGGLSGSRTWSDASSRSIESVRTVATEAISRTVQNMTRSFSVRTRSTEELSQTSSFRKLIDNKTDKPINYGLVRMHSKVSCRTQLTRRFLCWRALVSTPGNLLARPELVTTDVVPNGAELLAGRPEQSAMAATDKRIGSFQLEGFPTIDGKAIPPKDSAVLRSTEMGYVYVELKNVELTGSTLIRVKPSGGVLRVAMPGEEDPPVVWTSQYRVDSVWQKETYIRFRIALVAPDAVPAGWPETGDDVSGFRESLRNDLSLVLERERPASASNAQLQKLIAAELRAAKRPERDLRLEESMAVEALLKTRLSVAIGVGDPARLSEVFDFTLMHTRAVDYQTSSGGSYGTLGDLSAPLGASVGWAHTFDGDEARNRFVNAKRLEVVVPIRPGRETEAISLLSMAKEITDGAIGTICKLLGEVRAARQSESDFDKQGLGPDDVLDGNNNVPLNDYYPVSKAKEETYPIAGFAYKTVEV